MSIYSGVGPLPSLLWQPAVSNWDGHAACRNDEGRRAMSDAIDYPKSEWAGPAAKAFCKRCPVRKPCLADNLDLRHGVVGGLDEFERDLLRRRQQRRKVSAHA